MSVAPSGKTNDTARGISPTTGLSTRFGRNVPLPQALSTEFPHSRLERPRDRIREHRPAILIHGQPPFLRALRASRDPGMSFHPVEDPLNRTRVEIVIDVE